MIRHLPTAAGLCIWYTRSLTPTAGRWHGETWNNHTANNHGREQLRNNLLMMILEVRSVLFCVMMCGVVCVDQLNAMYNSSRKKSSERVQGAGPTKQKNIIRSSNRILVTGDQRCMYLWCVGCAVVGPGMGTPPCTRWSCGKCEILTYSINAFALEQNPIFEFNCDCLLASQFASHDCLLCYIFFFFPLTCSPSPSRALLPPSP